MKTLIPSILFGIILSNFVLANTNIFKTYVIKRTTYYQVEVKDDKIEAIAMTTVNPDVAKTICEVFGHDLCKTAVAIAMCESRLDPTRVGDKSLIFWDGDDIKGMSVGVFQIRALRGRPEPEQLKNARFNIEYAKQLHDRQGFQPWTCFTNGGYERWM